KSDYALQRTGDWNTLGMRGTCSSGLIVRAVFAPVQVLDRHFGDIANETMVPVSHLLLSAVWLGIAADALGRAHGYLCAEARRQTRTPQPAALRIVAHSAD